MKLNEHAIPVQSGWDRVVLAWMLLWVNGNPKAGKSKSATRRRAAWLVATVSRRNEVGALLGTRSAWPRPFQERALLSLSRCTNRSCTPTSQTTKCHCLQNKSRRSRSVFHLRTSRCREKGRRGQGPLEGLDKRHPVQCDFGRPIRFARASLGLPPSRAAPRARL